MDPEFSSPTLMYGTWRLLSAGSAQVDARPRVIARGDLVGVLVWRPSVVRPSYRSRVARPCRPFCCHRAPLRFVQVDADATEGFPTLTSGVRKACFTAT